jgi:membrane associated rhomboid family serine protease
LALVTNEQAPMVCYRHPDRATRITCRRCDKPICGECMIPAAVGFQCPSCVRAFTKQTRQHEGPYGGAISGNPTLTTYVLIGVNVAVFALIFLTGWSNSGWANWLGLAPLESCHVVGGRCEMVPGVAYGALWQIVTSLFTHEQWMHIGMNLLTLWFLGPPLERIFGRARFLALYLLSGLTGSAAVMWLSAPTSITIGASGCLFGLIAGLIIVLHKLKQDFRQILLWLGLNVLITAIMWRSISWQGHLGGLIGGAIVAALLVYLPKKHRDTTQWVTLGAYAVVLIALIVVRALMLR